MNAPIVVVYVHGPNQTPRVELRGNVARHFARDIERFSWGEFYSSRETGKVGVRFDKPVRA